jgi:hypothetical protein
LNHASVLHTELTLTENSTLGVIAIMIYQFRFQRFFMRLSALLVFSFWLLAGYSFAQTHPDSPSTTAADVEQAFKAPRNGAAAHGVCLFTLHNGVCTPQFFSLDDLNQDRPLEIEGYVVGVVVFGPGDLKVELGEQKFRPIRSNADGTFHVKGYGKFNPAELSARTHMAKGGQGLPRAVIEPPCGPGESAFYYFPKVFGAAVSSQPHFELQLADNDARQVIEVRHRPVQKIDWADYGRNIPSSTFYYVGHRLDDLLDTRDGFQNRLAAIYEGIRTVEEAFGLDLVQDVQLIDLNSRNNALTYDGRNTIWFYIDTVLGTSAEELRRMASHEALHQMVYQLRLAHHSPVRRFFADLWSLDKLSMARFQMVTTGWFDTRTARISPASSLFFSFINEKNFMRGMNGGHSHDNLDEFLTSFIHSLLYIHKLDGNIDAPVRLYGGNAQHRLTDMEKERVLDRYKTSLVLLKQTIEAAPSNATRNLGRLLEEGLNAIEQIQADQEKARPAASVKAALKLP